MNEITEKLLDIKEKFLNDEEVKALITKLSIRLGEITESELTEEEQMSDELVEANEEYYSQLRELDPDELDIFDILWFK